MPHHFHIHLFSFKQQLKEERIAMNVVVLAACASVRDGDRRFAVGVWVRRLRLL